MMRRDLQNGIEQIHFAIHLLNARQSWCKLFKFDKTNLRYSSFWK